MITYHRTDSTALSKDIMSNNKDFVVNRYGKIFEVKDYKLCTNSRSNKSTSIAREYSRRNMKITGKFTDLFGEEQLLHKCRYGTEKYTLILIFRRKGIIYS